jgi:hypothetical protein
MKVYINTEENKYDAFDLTYFSSLIQDAWLQVFKDRRLTEQFSIIFDSGSSSDKSIENS